MCTIEILKHGGFRGRESNLVAKVAEAPPSQAAASLWYKAHTHHLLGVLFLWRELREAEVG